MTIYAAMTDPTNAALQPALEKHFEGAFYKLAEGEYLISATGTTTRQLAERIGIQDGSLGRVILVHVDNWWGWHAKDVWEWLSAQSLLRPNADGQPTDGR